MLMRWNWMWSSWSWGWGGRVGQKIRMTKNYRWKERVPRWLMVPTWPSRRHGSLPLCQGAEVLGLDNWGIIVALKVHELHCHYPARKHYLCHSYGALSPPAPLNLYVPHLKGNLDEIMPVLPTKYIVHNHKSLKNSFLDLEHIWIWFEMKGEYFVMCSDFGVFVVVVVILFCFVSS